MKPTTPEDLHDATFRFLKLLDRFHTGEDINERDFHDLFEKYDVIWDCLGYSNVVSEPSCELLIEDDISGKYIEPDFFAYSEYKNRWEIIDLKLPLESLILRSEGRRRRFTSKVEDYVAQIREYNQYFNEHDHRKHVESKHGIKIPKSPPVALVLGSNIEQKEIDDVTDRYDIDLDVYQYDHILDLLRNKIKEHTESSDSLPGATLATVIELKEQPTDGRGYLFDMGQEVNSNRVSLFVEKGVGLVLETTTKHGKSRKITVPLGDDLDIGEPAIVYIEIASSEGLSYVRMFLGPKILDEFVTTEEVPIDIFDDDGDMNISFGADMLGNNNGAFLMGEHLTYSKIHSLSTRLEIIDYLWRKWGFD